MLKGVIWKFNAVTFFRTASRLNVMYLNREGCMRSLQQQFGNLGNCLALVSGTVHLCCDGNSKGGQCPGWRVAPVTGFGRLREDRTPVLKHLRVDTMNCVS